MPADRLMKQEPEIVDSFEKAAITAIQRLADRIENIRRLYTKSKSVTISELDRRDMVVQMHAEIENIFQETLGYAKTRGRPEDFLEDIEGTQDEYGVSEPLVVLAIIVGYLEIFGLYTSSDRMPPNDAKIIRDMLMRSGKIVSVAKARQSSEALGKP